VIIRNPEITVCFPVYNGKKYIKKSLNHTIKQFIKYNIKGTILISNNASTDNTLFECKKLKKYYSFIKIFNKKKKIPLCKNYNFLLKKVKSNFFVFHSHDDYRLDNFYNICLQKLKNNPKAILAYTHANYFDEDESKIYRKEKCNNMGQGRSLNERFVNTLINHETCAFHGVYRTKEVKKIGYTNNFLGSDHIFLNQLSCLGEFIEIKKNLMLMHESKSKWIDGSIENKVKNFLEEKTFLFPFSRIFFKSLFFAFKAQKKFLKNLFLLIISFNNFYKYFLKYDLTFIKFKIFKNYNYYKD
jgi:glycosyltransferase involved in cell wall biosynthesis